MGKISLLLVLAALLICDSDAYAESRKSMAKKLARLRREVSALIARPIIAGPQGAPGVVGPQGVAGAQGPAGASAFAPIPSGAVVYGVIGDNISSNIFFEAFASLPAPAPVVLDSINVVVKATPALIAACGGSTCLSANEQVNQGLCNGTSTFPNPSTGVVCIYPEEIFTSSSIALLSFEGLAITSDNGTGSRFGFKVSYQSNSSGLNYMSGVWAYRAP